MAHWATKDTDTSCEALVFHLLCPFYRDHISHVNPHFTILASWNIKILLAFETQIIGQYMYIVFIGRIYEKCVSFEICVLPDLISWLGNASKLLFYYCFHTLCLLFQAVLRLVSQATCLYQLKFSSPLLNVGTRGFSWIWVTLAITFLSPADTGELVMPVFAAFWIFGVFSFLPVLCSDLHFIWAEGCGVNC